MPCIRFMKKGVQRIPQSTEGIKTDEGLMNSVLEITSGIHIKMLTDLCDVFVHFI